MGSRSLGFVVSMFTMGYFADKFGRTPILLFGLGATAFLMVVINFATTFELLVAVLFTLGITTGAIWIVCPVLAAESVDLSHRGAAIGTYRTFFDLGSILGPILMTLTQEAYGISTCYYLSAAILFLNLIPSRMLMEIE